MLAQYDKSKIGKYIASGGDRKVYRYGADEVIKISSLSFIVGKRLRIKMMDDYNVCKRYFGDYVVDTIEVTGSSSRDFVQIQKYIQGAFLSSKHRSDPQILTQLKEIVSIMEKMKRDGYPVIDLVGNIGMTSMCLSNVIVDKNNRLHIIDATLLEGRSVGTIDIVMGIFMPLVRYTQKHIIRQILR